MAKAEKLKASPEIERFWFTDEFPQKLDGDVVVVDAYAATSNTCILLAKNPQHLIVVNENTLNRARKIYPDAISVGESETLDPEEFQATNELSQIRKVEVKGKNVLWMSINGSKLVEKVMGIEVRGKIIAGSFSNMQSVADYLRQTGKKVSIIMAGDRKKPAAEDRICGEVIENLILSRPINWKAKRKEIEKFVKSYYDYDDWTRNLEFLVEEKYWNEFDLLPAFFVNEEGFIEVKGQVY